MISLLRYSFAHRNGKESITLAAGTRLGPYELLASIGAGGMGEVWRARDGRLGREVAVKVISGEIVHDSRALARFESEAKAVAALSHPNIMAIHDVGESSGVHYAVMELLAGESLRAVLGRGPLTVRRSLEIASQLADALAVAHEKGIIHRDIKPENVFVTKEAQAKLLDFGLVKVRETEPEGDSTRTVTEPGTVVGTASYMSPEQAQGITVDHRTDQFSLGIVLYEMLSGKQPFRRASGPQTLAAIIQEEAEPLDGHARSVPAPVRWLVERLLSKETAGRYDSTRDLARDLRNLSLRLSEATSGSGSATAGHERSKGWRRGTFLILTGAALIALGALGSRVFLGYRPSDAAPVLRTEVRLPEGHFLPPHRRNFALSPDGRTLAFSAATWKVAYSEQNQPRIYLRRLGSFEILPIHGTEGGVQPVFSPDGRQVAFSVRTAEGILLKRVPLDGGPATTVCRCVASYGIAWPANGVLLFAAGGGPIMRVPETGGTPEPVTSLDSSVGEVSHRLPHVLPDGRTLIYTALRWHGVGMTWQRAQIFAQRIGERERRLVLEGGSDARWVAPGHVLFAQQGSIMAAPFDANALRLTDKPVLILEGVSHSIWTSNSVSETGAAMLDVAKNGTLAFVPGSVAPEHSEYPVWIDSSGRESPIDLPHAAHIGYRISAEGTRLLLGSDYPGKQLEVVDLLRGSRRKVTFGANPLWAIWGPGPDDITFMSDHEGPTGIYSRSVNAPPDEIKTLWKGSGHWTVVGSWSRDGSVLAFVVMNPTTGHDIWLLENGKSPRPFLQTAFSEAHPDISPDGRWILYVSNEPGESEVFVRPVSGSGAPQIVSTGGGGEPLWARDGSAIFYWTATDREAGSALVRVRVEGRNSQGLSLGRPEKLFETENVSSAYPGHSWDVGPDGRFVVNKIGTDSELRARSEKLSPDRIRIDIGGLPELLAGARKKP